MQSTPPAALELAQQLRQLREQHWPDARLTQSQLAKAFSAEGSLAAATVSSWESQNVPKIPPRHRVLAYARFFASTRSIEAAPKLLQLEELTADEEAAYAGLAAKLLRLRDAARGGLRGEELALKRYWYFPDTGRITLVCSQLPEEERGPLAVPSDPNYTEVHAYADADALMELHGHIRAENPQMTVYRRIPPEVEPDDLTGHVVLLGGVVWNEITGRLSEMARLPVRQVTGPELSTGDIFVAEVDGEERQFWPKWADGGDRLLAEDVGLLARVPNPLNRSRTLTICNGIHTRGVYGAVRTLTDAQLRDSNERYISANFGNSDSFAILMSVKVIKNRAMTPDLGSEGVVLYQWPGGIAA